MISCEAIKTKTFIYSLTSNQQPLYKLTPLPRSQGESNKIRMNKKSTRFVKKKKITVNEFYLQSPEF